MDRLNQIHDRLKPQKAALLSHPIYGEIDGLESLRVFMEHHVFAVWDFMSLLKALQRQLCCVEVPWLPAADAQAARFINEIVLGEESDEDGRGGFASHFELYHRAMTRCGANPAAVNGFLGQLRRSNSVNESSLALRVGVNAALESAGVPECARQFVRHTFEFVAGGNLVAVASAFFFGREDLLPAVFQQIVDRLNVDADGGLEDFKYYLERHIGLDGEEHGPMANQLLLSLCGGDESRWQVAEQAAAECLDARQRLWDGIRDAIVVRRSASH